MWMLHPSDHERSLSNIVMATTPLLSPLLSALGSSSTSGCGSVALSRTEGGGSASPKERASTEAALIWALWPKLESDLETKGLTKTFRGTQLL